MADISKINIDDGDGTEYNIKDTTARDGLTDRPTSFVGTRSEWNALPVATQVKYSLVNLIGEGVYKNNGTGLDDIADVGGGASNNFQGTIEEWNALTTEEKKAYDHASIPDSLDGNVTFPASKVMLPSGTSLASGVACVKLWDNTSPSASFAGQNVQIDGLTDYDIYMIFLSEGCIIMPKGGNGRYTYPGTSGGVAYIWYRYASDFSVTQANTLHFSDSVKFKMSDGTNSTDNSSAIPLTVYGIKVG